MPRLGRARPSGAAQILAALPVARNAAALSQWGTALSGLNSTAAKWLAIGDGITEGQGASTRANRWIEQALATIRTSKSVTGGQGFVSAAYAVTGADSPWATSQVAYAGTTQSGATAGIGYRYIQLDASGTVTFTVTGTAVDLWYISESAAGTFTYKVDAGSTTTVDSAGAHDLKRISGISLGAAGSHTVQVARTAGTVYITGLTVYNGDAATGIQLYDAARTGVTSTAYASDLVMVADLAAMTSPDLVSIELGTNDAAAQIAPTTTAANITSIITTLRGLAKVPSIILVIPHYPVPAAGTTTSITTGFGLVPFGTSPFGVGVTTTTASGALSRTGWTVTADSEETSGENAPATNVLDGNTGTYWHSHWSGGVQTPLPHNIVIDMKAQYTATALRYLPRGAAANGNIGQYTVEVSTDGTTWTSVASGTWADTATEKTASFAATTARYVRLTGITEAGARGVWSSAAELNVDGATASTPTGWPDYVAVLRRLVAADPSLAALDLSLALPAADTSGTGLYRTDGKHPSDSGHAAVAAQFTNLANLAVTVAPGATSTGGGRMLMLAGVA